MNSMIPGIKYQAKLNGQVYQWVESDHGLIKATSFLNFKWFQVDSPKINGEDQVNAMCLLDHNPSKKSDYDWNMKKYEALGKVLAIS